MYFIRYFNNGEAARTRFAVYRCSVCNKEHWIQAGQSFKPEPRSCPDCKVYDSNDKKRELIRQRDELTSQISIIQSKLDRVNVELLTMEEMHEPSLQNKNSV